MNKQDVLDALNTKFAAVLRVKQVDRLDGVAWYVATVLDINGDAAIRKNVSFYVVDEGTQIEQAYWKGGEPKPTPGPVTFQQELVAWLDTTVADDTVLFYNVVGTLPTVERARVDVVREQSGSYVEAKLGVYKDASGSFQYEVIT